MKSSFNPLTHWGEGPIAPPLFERHVVQKVIKLKKIWKNKLFHGNHLSFKFVFRCFFKKSRFIQVIHGYLGQPKIWGPECS
jgi:hypothetical protein